MTYKVTEKIISMKITAISGYKMAISGATINNNILFLRSWNKSHSPPNKGRPLLEAALSMNILS